MAAAADPKSKVAAYLAGNKTGAPAVTPPIKPPVVAPKVAPKVAVPAVAAATAKATSAAASVQKTFFKKAPTEPTPPVTPAKIMPETFPLPDDEETKQPIAETDRLAYLAYHAENGSNPLEHLDVEPTEEFVDAWVALLEANGLLPTGQGVVAAVDEDADPALSVADAGEVGAVADAEDPKPEAPAQKTAAGKRQGRPPDSEEMKELKDTVKRIEKGDGVTIAITCSAERADRLEGLLAKLLG